jgi:hypothetical protein
MNQFLWVLKSKENKNRDCLIPILRDEADVFSRDPNALGNLSVLERGGGRIKKLSCFDIAPPHLVTINEAWAIDKQGEHFCVIEDEHIKNQERYVGMLIVQRYDGYQPYRIIGR